MLIDHTGPARLGRLLCAPDEPRSLPGIPGGGPSQPPLPTSEPLWGGKPSQPPAPSASPSGSQQPTYSPAPAPQQPPPPGQAPSPYSQPTGTTVFQAPPPMQAQPGQGTFVLSGWGRRAGAQIIDWIVILAIVIAFSVVIVALVGDDPATDDTNTTAGDDLATFFGIMLFFIAAAALYAPTWMAFTNGSTLGKKIFGIRVVRASGEKVGFGYAFVREVLVKGLLFGWLGLWLFLPWLLNYLWPLWDSENRAGHDFVARSRVVLDR
jgi:uncharacterized RDD family membrane protein YckC